MENKEKGYNGWTNYETWLVSLWIDNDEALQTTVKNLCKQKFQYNFKKDEALKGIVEEYIFLDEASLRTDLIKSALSEVNWTEIINSFEAE